MNNIAVSIVFSSAWFRREPLPVRRPDARLRSRAYASYSPIRSFQLAQVQINFLLVSLHNLGAHDTQLPLRFADLASHVMQREYNLSQSSLLREHTSESANGQRFRAVRPGGRHHFDLVVND